MDVTQITAGLPADVLWYWRGREASHGESGLAQQALSDMRRNDEHERHRRGKTASKRP
jgi:hypothetical protein